MDSTQKSPKEKKELMLVSKLREVLGRMEIATMMSSDGMAWTDEDGRMEWCNSAFEDVVGRPRTDMIGQPLVEVFPLIDERGQLVSKADHPVTVVLNEMNHGSYIYRFAGSQMDLQLEVAYAPTSASNEKVSAVVVARPLAKDKQEVDNKFGEKNITDGDVGDQLVALVDENAELAKKISLLEEQLVEAELRAADNLDAGYQTKSAFLGNMTHELRTPLSAIMGYADLLRRELLAQGHFNWAKDLAQIRHASDQLFFMITELLDLAAIEEDQNELHSSRFKVEKLLSDVSSVAREYMVEQHNVLNVTIGDDLPDELKTDEPKLRKILLHLLSNAAKFTVKGQVNLVVNKVDFGGSDGLTFQVIDDGIGMTSQQISRIFDAFTQADESLTRSYEGGGVGLYICHRFCEQLGGTIGVSSQPGAGSCFTVTIPVELPDDRL